MVTVNITCMMVLASVYLSVSASLPSTPVIKPVERWLLFSLAYPFFVIVTATLQQAMDGQTETPGKTRNIKVRPDTGQLATLTIQNNEILSEIGRRRIISKILDKSLKIVLPLVSVVFAVMYWIEYAVLSKRE